MEPSGHLGPVVGLTYLVPLLSLYTFLTWTGTGYTDIRVNYQLDANIVYFSSKCFGPIRSSSGAIEFIISFTNAAYGVL